MAGCLALFAALTVSVLPSGLMPKIAGKCGRQLCNCEPDAFVQTCKGCKPNSAPRTLANFNVTLVNAAISDSDARGTAFQEVFSGVVAPNKLALPSAANNAEISVPSNTAFALANAAAERATPPPRSEYSL